MKTKKVHIGVEEASRGYDRFIDAWNKAESGSKDKTEIHLNFEDFAMLGPMNVRSLSNTVGRDYKNVHVDSTELEDAGLIQRNEDGLLIAPWDVIDAQFRLVA